MYVTAHQVIQDLTLGLYTVLHPNMVKGAFKIFQHST